MSLCVSLPAVAGGAFTVENTLARDHRETSRNVTALQGEAHGLPHQVTPSTKVWINIAALDINSLIPYELCGFGAIQSCSYQEVILRFSSGPPLILSLDEQWGDYHWGFGYDYLSADLKLGTLYWMNLSSAFVNDDKNYQQPLYITSIELVQQLGPLEANAAIDYHQKMTVDLIRIED